MALPDFTTQDPATYKANIDSSMALAATKDGDTITNATLDSCVVNGGTIAIQTAKASTSGTNIDFTGIPNWAKRITILFDSVSTASGTPLELYLGTSSGFDTTGTYEWIYTQNIVAASPTVLGNSLFTRFRIASIGDGTSAISGRAVLEKVTGNLWVLSSTFKSHSPLLNVQTGSGLKTLASDLTQVRVYASGVAFDAGQINITYE